MSKNVNLHKAKKEKNDEFYTRLEDIKAELKHYKEHFKEKVVYCNCDDPKHSNFVKYFIDNFEYLGLKRLIATCYVFGHKGSKQAACFVYDGDENDSSISGRHEIEAYPLQGDGDFRSKECIELLKEADIVVTNPPFSLFREYVAQLIEYDKKFLIIGNMNAITYKEIFKLIKDGKLWLGVSIYSGDREFGVPNNYPLKASGYRIDDEGKKYIRVKGVRWFTNLEHGKRNEKLPLYKKYKGNEDKYPFYDNYNAINVDKVADIPCDVWEVPLGVPISFLDKWSPEQFEVIRFRKGLDNKDLIYKLSNGLVKQPYFRIIIKRKK